MTDQDSPEFVPEETNEREPRPAPRASYSRRQELRSTRLEVGTVIGNTFSIWSRNLVPFSALALLIYLPVLIIGYLFWEGAHTEQEVVRFKWIMWGAEQVFFASLLAGTLTYGVVMQLRGKRADIGNCVKIGLSRILHVFGVSILVALMSVLWFVPGYVVLQGGNIGLGALLLSLAVLPLLIIMLTYYVAVPATVVERVGVIEALSRSAALTKGLRMTIFGILFLFGLLVFVIAIPFGVVIGFVIGTGVEMAPSTFYVIQTLIGVLLAPLTAILPGVIYHDLRVGKEGVDVKDLAAVFE
ncbi:MAG: hypothetical protein ABFS86_01380 [Planctomycetota bacterium]